MKSGWSNARRPCRRRRTKKHRRARWMKPGTYDIAVACFCLWATISSCVSNTLAPLFVLRRGLSSTQIGRTEQVRGAQPAPSIPHGSPVEDQRHGVWHPFGLSVTINPCLLSVVAATDLSPAPLFVPRPRQHAAHSYRYRHHTRSTANDSTAAGARAGDSVATGWPRHGPDTRRW